MYNKKRYRIILMLLYNFLIISYSPHGAVKVINTVLSGLYDNAPMRKQLTKIIKPVLNDKYSCQGKCGNSQVFALDKIPKCQCDSECVYLGDCCLDYFYYCAPDYSDNGTTTTAEDFMHTLVSYYLENTEVLNLRTLMKCGQIPGMYNYHLVISLCPESYAGPDVEKTLCESAPTTGFLAEDLMYYEGYGLFRNQHCVKCHDLNLHQVLSFTIDVYCDESAADEIQKLANNKSQFTEAIKSKCQLQAKLYGDLYEFHKRFLERHVCYRTTNEFYEKFITNPSTIDNKDVLRVLCATFVLTVKTSTTQRIHETDIFANPYCVLAAGVKKMYKSIEAVDRYWSQSVVLQSPSFILMFDFTVSESMSINMFRRRHGIMCPLDDSPEVSHTDLPEASRTEPMNNTAPTSISSKSKQTGLVSWSMVFVLQKTANKYIILKEINETLICNGITSKCNSSLYGYEVKVTEPRWCDHILLLQTVKDSLCIFLSVKNNTNCTILLYREYTGFIYVIESILKDISDRFNIYNNTIQKMLVYNFDILSSYFCLNQSQVAFLPFNESFNNIDYTDIALKYDLTENIANKLGFRGTYYSFKCDNTYLDFNHVLLTLLCSSISMAFLAFTIVVHLSLSAFNPKASNHVLHLSVSLLFAQLFFQVHSFSFLNSYMVICSNYVNVFIFQISGIDVLKDHQQVCQFIGVALHFMWTTSFSIMTYIAFDLTYRFTNINQPWYTKKSGKSKKIFFCWVLNILYISICVILDIFTDLDLAYGAERGMCFIQPNKSLLYLFVIPVLALATINLACFITVIISVYTILQGNAEALDNIDKENILIFARIFSLMGITWLFGLLPTLVGVFELWYVFIFANALQGLYIFLSFGINKKVRKILYNRLSKFFKGD